MLNIRLYDDPEKMLEIEGSREEILRSFFNEMVEEKNFNIAFCEWFKKKYYFFRIGNYYACANDDLVQQVLRLEELIKNKGYSSYKLRQDHLFSESTITKFRNNNVNITVENLNTLCHLLNCQPGDILEYIPDED